MDVRMTLMTMPARILVMAFAAVLSLPVQADMVSYTSDAGFVADAGFTRAFGGSVRWGNGASNGDWEASVVNSNDVPDGVGNPRQVAWTGGLSGVAHGVSFTFDALTNDTVLALDFTGAADVSSSWLDVPANPAINAIFLRARANGGDVASLSNVVLTTGGQFFNLGALVGDSDAEYIGFVSPLLAAGFSVTAIGTIADGNGSLPMYQFKVGAVPPVPLPAAAWLLASGLGLLAYQARRRRAVR
jgi:hypothetical protein